MPILRRRFLKTSAAIGALLTGGKAVSAGGRFTGSGTPMALALTDALRKYDAAGAIGHAYLNAVPSERAIGRLRALIETALANGAGGRLDGDRLLRRFAEVRRHEFAAEDVAVVDGWVLSRTEARLYALRALDRRP